MVNKKIYNNKSKESITAEPETTYRQIQFHFFNSFEEEQEFTARQRANLSYDERIFNIEELRKFIFRKHLLPNGKWPAVEKVFKIMNPYKNESGK